MKQYLKKWHTFKRSILHALATKLFFLFSLKLGNGVSTSVQLFWMGVLAIVVAGLSEFVDDNDRFFTPDIGQITAFEWGICIWIACQGKDEVLTCMSWSCYLPPKTVI